MFQSSTGRQNIRSRENSNARNIPTFTHETQCACSGYTYARQTFPVLARRIKVRGFILCNKTERTCWGSPIFTNKRNVSTLQSVAPVCVCITDVKRTHTQGEGQRARQRTQTHKQTYIQHLPSFLPSLPVFLHIQNTHIHRRTDRWSKTRECRHIYRELRQRQVGNAEKLKDNMHTRADRQRQIESRHKLKMTYTQKQTTNPVIEGYTHMPQREMYTYNKDAERQADIQGKIDTIHTITRESEILDYRQRNNHTKQKRQAYTKQHRRK